MTTPARPLRRALVAFAVIATLAAPVARALTPAETTAAIAAIDRAAAKALVEKQCDPDLGGRRSGTEACRVTAERIRDAMKSAGVAAEIVTALDFSHVIATIEGSDKKDEAILVSCHFDGPGEIAGKICPAADESASGAAALVEIARGLVASKAKPRRTVVLAAFSGYWDDEDAKRYRAARAWAEQSKLRLVYHVDVAMCGVGLFPKEPGRLFAVGAESGVGADELVKSAIAAEPSLKVTRCSVYLIEGQGPRDNYSGLRELGVPFVFISAGVTKFYHKPEDVPATIDPERIANAAKLALRVLGEADGRDQAPAFKKDPPTDDASDAKEVLAIVEAALDETSGLEFSKSAREAMTYKRDKVREMVERGGELTKKDKAYLQRTLESLLFVLIK